MAFRREKREANAAARGRQAQAPGDIPARGWKDVLLRVKDEIGADRVSLIAAGVAFYGLLAIFPGIAAVVAIAGIVIDPETIVDQIDALGALLPQEAAEIIVGQATSVASADSGGLGFAAAVGILISLWSASAAMRSMMQGLNVAYDEEETRGLVRLTLLRLGLTLGVIAGLIVVFAIAVVLPIVLAFFPLGDFANVAVTILRWALMFALAACGLAILYRYGPSRDEPGWRWVTPGALAATALWVIGSLGFAFYVTNFASYNETFGTLGGVVVLLMWMWLSAYIVLLGAELDSEIEAQTRHDTTVGAPRPMGERDAVKADELGAAKA